MGHIITITINNIFYIREIMNMGSGNNSELCDLWDRIA
jgi:hypothetical protein